VDRFIFHIQFFGFSTFGFSVFYLIGFAGLQGFVPCRLLTSPVWAKAMPIAGFGWV
jgi:hypothetical protein